MPKFSNPGWKNEYNVVGSGSLVFAVLCNHQCDYTLLAFRVRVHIVLCWLTFVSPASPSTCPTGGSLETTAYVLGNCTTGKCDVECLRVDHNAVGINLPVLGSAAYFECYAGWGIRYAFFIQGGRVYVLSAKDR